MSFVRTTMACAVLAMSVLAGCEKTDDATTPGGTAGAGASSGAATGGASDATAATPGATDATAATPAAAPTPAATPDASTATPAAASDPAATQPAGAAAAATTAQAQTLLDQSIAYIKENKLDLADKSLTQLEALKPQLPAAYHSKVDAARKAFNAAKTGQGLKLDGLLPAAK